MHFIHSTHVYGVGAVRGGPINVSKQDPLSPPPARPQPAPARAPVLRSPGRPALGACVGARNFSHLVARATWGRVGPGRPAQRCLQAIWPPRAGLRPCHRRGSPVATAPGAACSACPGRKHRSGVRKGGDGTRLQGMGPKITFRRRAAPRNGQGKRGRRGRGRGSPVRLPAGPAPRRCSRFPESLSRFLGLPPPTSRSLGVVLGSLPAASSLHRPTRGSFLCTQARTSLPLSCPPARMPGTPGHLPPQDVNRCEFERHMPRDPPAKMG